MTEELPEGWTTVRLADVGQWYGGATPSKSKSEFWENGVIPWISPKDMRQEVLREVQDRITEEAVESSPVRLVPGNSVAFVVRSGVLERRFPVALTVKESTLNQDMKAIHPYEGVDSRWIAWCLRWMEQPILRDCRKSGTTVASLESVRIKEVEIPLPPLAEQRRIVAALEVELSRLDVSMGDLDSILGKIEYLRISLIKKSFQGEVRKLGDLFSVAVGSTPSRGDSSNWNGDIPWVSSGEVSFGRISETRERIARSAIGSRSDRIHPPGTVLIAMIGEGKTRGQVAILDIHAAHNQNCASIRVSESDHSPEYVYYFLKGRYEETRRSSAGGSQLALNKAKVREIEIPMVSPVGQVEVVEKLNKCEEKIGRLQEEVADVIRRANQLKRALLTAAFTGKIVPQDPTDEPASELLGRIRAEHAFVPKPKRGRRANTPQSPRNPVPIPEDSRPVPAGEQTALEV